MEQSEFDNQGFLDLFQSKLYSHQIQALQQMNDNETGIIASFCGTGKSRIMIEFIMQIYNQYHQSQIYDDQSYYNDEGLNEHILIVFPSLALLNQFYESYVKYIEGLKSIQICSQSPAKLTEEWFDNQFSLILVTYQSLYKISKYINHLTVALFDESHHICTKKRIKLIQNISGKRFYFTATPKQTKYLDMFDERSMVENQPAVVEESKKKKEKTDDVSTFTCGGIIFEYDFMDALDDEVVCDYQLLFRLYKDSNPKENKEQKQLQAILGLAEQHNRTRIIVFNQYMQSASHCKTNCQKFQLGHQNIKIVGAVTSKDKRTQIFDWFQDDSPEIKIICNVSCIKEGVDLPCTDMIVFCDEKQSKIQIIQSLGRGTRKHFNKKDCLVTCLIDYQIDIQELTHIENELVKQKFRMVQYICNALKRIDYRIEQVMRNEPSTLKFNISSENYEIQNIGNDQQFIDIIRTNFVNSIDLDARFDFMLQLCIKFKEKYKWYPREKANDNDEKRLGIWTSCQKQSLKQKGTCKMTKYRIDKLNEYLLDFFNRPNNAEIWQYNLDECLQFKNVNNRYPRNGMCRHEKKMASWTRCNYNELKKGHDCVLNDNQKSQLVDYLMEYKTNDDKWQQQFNDCRQFLQQKGKYPSCSSKNDSEQILGAWMQCNKRKFENQQLSQSKHEQMSKFLEQWYQQLDKEQIWNQTLMDSQNFLEVQGRYPKLWKDADQQEQKLAMWISDNKKALRGSGTGLMTEERREKLNQFLSKYLTKKQRWQKTMDECVLFNKTNFKYPKQSGAKDETEKRLGQWVSDQLKLLRKGSKILTNDRHTQLEEYFINYDSKNGIGQSRTSTRKKIVVVNSQINMESQTSQMDDQIQSGNSRQYPEISKLHKEFKVLHSRNLNEKFVKEPQLWKQYHQISEENESKFADQENVPYKRIISYLTNMKFKRQKLVLDLGCGTNRVAKALQNDQRFQFICYDHVAIDNTVQECDISQLPNEDDSVNICILSLALWGSNCLDYLNEAHRILEQNGILLLIEPVKRWMNEQQENRLITELNQRGFSTKLISSQMDRIQQGDLDKFMFIEAMKI